MAVNIDFLNANSINNINTNFQRVGEALEKVVGRDGDNPNQMNVDLDMDSNDILNVGVVEADSVSIAGVPIGQTNATFKGNWNSITNYIVNDIVRYDDILWIAKRSNNNVTPVEGDDWTVFLEASGVSDGDKGDIIVSNSGVTWKTKAVFPASNRTEMASFITSLRQVAYLNESGREGEFVLRNVSDFTSEIAADTEQGIFVPSTDDASKVWMRVFDTLTPFMFGAKADGSSDDGSAINAMFYYVARFEHPWELVGDFLTSVPIILGRSDDDGESPVASKAGHFGATITTTYTDTDDTAFLINCVEESTITGSLHVICGSASLVSRRQRHAIYVKACSRSTIGDLFGYGTVREAVVVESSVSPDGNNNNLCKFAGLHVRNAGYLATTTISSFTQDGSSGSFGQRSTITVPSIPDDLEVGDWILHNGYAHWITDITTGKIEVFPWIIGASNGDTIIYHVGAGARLQGGDVSINNFGHIDIISAPIGLKQMALYGPFIETFHYNYGSPFGDTADAGIGFINGIAPQGALEGCSIGNFYCEDGTELQYVQLTSAQTSTNINTLTAAPSGIAGFQAISPNANDGLIGFGLCNCTISNHDGRSYGFSGSSKRSQTSSNAGIDNTHDKWTFRANTMTLHLNWNEAANDVFGYDSMIVLIVGGATGGAPSGTITFDSADGKTINGLSSDTFNSFDDKPAMFSIIFDYENQNWFVTLR